MANMAHPLLISKVPSITLRKHYPFHPIPLPSRTHKPSSSTISTGKERRRGGDVPQKRSVKTVTLVEGGLEVFSVQLVGSLLDNAVTPPIIIIWL